MGEYKHKILILANCPLAFKMERSISVVGQKHLLCNIWSIKVSGTSIVKSASLVQLFKRPKTAGYRFTFTLQKNLFSTKLYYWTMSIVIADENSWWFNNQSICQNYLWIISISGLWLIECVIDNTNIRKWIEIITKTMVINSILLIT